MNKAMIGKGLDTGRSLCVANILRALMQEGCKIVLGNYERGTVRTTVEGQFKTTDLRVVERILANQESFNISASCRVPVIQDRNGELISETAYRTYNLIRDGKVIVKTLFVSGMSEDTFTVLRNSGILYYKDGQKVMETHPMLTNTEYTINIEGLDGVSYAWAYPKRIGLVKMLKEDMDITEKLKSIRKLIKEYKAAHTDSSDTDTFTPEVKKGEVRETYTVNCIVYDLPKYKGVGFNTDVHTLYPDLESAQCAKREFEERQRDIRFMYRCIVYAVENATSDCGMNWDKLAPLPRSKNKQFQTCTFDGELLRRIEYTKEVEK